MAVYTPALMLQDGGAIAAALGYPVEVAYIVVKACLAIGLWGAAVGRLPAGAAGRLGARCSPQLAAFSLVLALPADRRGGLRRSPRSLIGAALVAEPGARPAASP